jgi:hypothetical protein
MTFKLTYYPLSEDHAEILRSHRDAIEDVKAQMVNFGWVKKAISPARLAQEIIDREIVPLDAVPYQEAIGVLIGDEIVAREGFVWLTVEDEYGRDPVTCHPIKSASVDPISAVVKRFERGEHQFDVEDFISEAVRICREKASDPRVEDLADRWCGQGSSDRPPWFLS